MAKKVAAWVLISFLFTLFMATTEFSTQSVHIKPFDTCS